MTDETVRDLEAFPFDEELENEQLGKPADTPIEGISALQKRHGLPLETDEIWVLQGVQSEGPHACRHTLQLAGCKGRGIL